MHFPLMRNLIIAKCGAKVSKRGYSSALMGRFMQYAPESSLLWPSNSLAKVIESIYVHSSLGWTSVIVLYTIGLRCSLLPIFLKQQKSSLAIQSLNPKLEVLKAEVKKLKENGLAEEAKKKTLEMTNVMLAGGVNPLLSFVHSLIPIPFFMSTFFAIRNLARQPIESLTQDGFLWISDLSLPDPYYIVPLISSLSLLSSIEVFEMPHLLFTFS
jgi:YidC/Oxa1 family membrane protein insertase